jgi:hypothetical protein
VSSTSDRVYYGSSSSELDENYFYNSKPATRVGLQASGSSLDQEGSQPITSKKLTFFEKSSPLVLDETRLQTACKLESIRDMEESIWADSPLTNEVLHEKMRPLAHQSALKLLNLTCRITDQTYQQWSLSNM